MRPADAATLKNDLAGLTRAEIVLVGTTEYHSADAGLDTTAIGGTNYSSHPRSGPQGYAAIGVPEPHWAVHTKATSLRPTWASLTSKTRSPQGLLSLDSNSNYNFHAGNNLQFECLPE